MKASIIASACILATCKTLSYQCRMQPYDISQRPPKQGENNEACPESCYFYQAWAGTSCEGSQTPYAYCDTVDAQGKPCWSQGGVQQWNGQCLLWGTGFYICIVDLMRMPDFQGIGKVPAVCDSGYDAEICPEPA